MNTSLLFFTDINFIMDIKKFSADGFLTDCWN